MTDTDACGTPIYYTNTMKFVTTFFDVQLPCGVATAPVVSGAAIQPCVIVAMSVEHARALAQSLQAVLVEYEANCGAVRSVPQGRGDG